MRAKFKEMKAKWENEKQAIGKVQKLREEIEQVNAEIEKARARLRSEQGRRATSTASCPQLQKAAGRGGEERRRGQNRRQAFCATR